MRIKKKEAERARESGPRRGGTFSETTYGLESPVRPAGTADDLVDGRSSELCLLPPRHSDRRLSTELSIPNFTPITPATRLVLLTSARTTPKVTGFNCIELHLFPIFAFYFFIYKPFLFYNLFFLCFQFILAIVYT